MLAKRQKSKRAAIFLAAASFGGMAVAAVPVVIVSSDSGLVDTIPSDFTDFADRRRLAGR